MNMTALSSHPDSRIDVLTVHDVPTDLVDELEALSVLSGRTLDAQVIHMLTGALALESHKMRAEALMAEIWGEDADLIDLPEDELVELIREEG